MSKTKNPTPQSISKGDAEKMINEFEKAFFMRCMAETDARKRAYETAKCKLIAALATEGKQSPQTQSNRVDIAAKALAESIGHGMREKCREHAEAVVAALDDNPSPQPTEKGK